MNKRKIGEKYENVALEYLIKNNYKIVDRNFRTKEGEIDIIAEDNCQNIVFIEVKYRKNNFFGYGEESINQKKCKKIFKIAEEYIIKNNILKNVRFDSIIIDGSSIRHIKNFFWGDEIGF